MWRTGQVFHHKPSLPQLTHTRRSSLTPTVCRKKTPKLSPSSIRCFVSFSCRRSRTCRIVTTPFNGAWCFVWATWRSLPQLTHTKTLVSVREGKARADALLPSTAKGREGPRGSLFQGLLQPHTFSSYPLARFWITVYSGTNVAYRSGLSS